jgi:hypothetical protein
MRRLLTWVLLSCALAACSDDDPTGPEEAVFEGLYQLIKVNGDTLPVVLEGDSVTFTILSGHYNLNRDETFTYQFSLTVAVLGGATTTENSAGLGFWARNNDAIFFQYADGSFPDAATIVGREMYMTIAAFPYVFRRE